MRIALLFNGRPSAAVSDAVTSLPDDAFEEYDDATTINAVAAALSDFGDVEAIEADAGLASRLQTGRFDIAFNIAEGTGRRGRESHAAAVCEMSGIPSTHSDAVTLGLTLDKMLARRVVSPDVPVAPAMLVDIDDTLPAAGEVPLPAVVKPNDEGSSKGIREDSLARNLDDVHRLLLRLRDRYGCPALIEGYLPGAEVTVGIVGNGASTTVLGLMEIAPMHATADFMYSVEVKRAFRERVRYFTPPRLPCATLREIERYALRAYRLFGCRDTARLDFRLDEAGVPHFLECNPLPGLNPQSSDLVIMTRGVMTHAELVQRIFREALRRYRMDAP